MDEQERTAFHEAGHVRIAYSINPASVGSVRIFDGDHGWEGVATIDLDEMDFVQKAAIAVAGLLSEARAVAMESDPSRRIATGAGLTAELGRVISIAVENRLERVPANVPTTIVPGGTQNVTAFLTIEDIEYIDDDISDDDEGIAAAAKLACDILNSGIEWTSINDVAVHLIEIAPDALENYAEFIAPHNF